MSKRQRPVRPPKAPPSAQKQPAERPCLVVECPGRAPKPYPILVLSSPAPSGETAPTDCLLSLKKAVWGYLSREVAHWRELMSERCHVWGAGEHALLRVPVAVPPHLRHELEKLVAEDGTVQLGAGPSWLRPVTARVSPSSIHPSRHSLFASIPPAARAR